MTTKFWGEPGAVPRLRVISGSDLEDVSELKLSAFEELNGNNWTRAAQVSGLICQFNKGGAQHNSCKSLVGGFAENGGNYCAGYSAQMVSKFVTSWMLLK